MSSNHENSRQAFIHLPEGTAKIEQFFTINQILLPFVNISSEQEEVKELSSWALIQNDLQKAKRALVRILATANSAGDLRSFDPMDSECIEQESLFIAFIITYGKCFAEGRGRSVRLNYKSVLKGKHANKIAAHKEIIEIRNKYIAHGDSSPYEYVAVKAALIPQLDQKEIVTVYFSKFSTSGLNLDAASKFIEVIEIFEEFVEENVSKCLKEVRRIVEQVPIDDVYQYAVFPPK
jgi:hypothetical protein